MSSTTIEYKTSREVPRPGVVGRQYGFKEPTVEVDAEGECRMSFSRGWNGYASNTTAKLARDLKAKELSASGCREVKRGSIAKQLRPYWGLMDPCGIVSNVYEVSWLPAEVTHVAEPSSPGAKPIAVGDAREAVYEKSRFPNIDDHGRWSDALREAAKRFHANSPTYAVVAVVADRLDREATSGGFHYAEAITVAAAMVIGMRKAFGSKFDDALVERSERILDVDRS